MVQEGLFKYLRLMMVHWYKHYAFVVYGTFLYGIIYHLNSNGRSQIVLHCMCEKAINY